MPLEINRSEVMNLMRDFQLLTGIRIVLFNENFEKVLGEPENKTSFCALMKSFPKTKALCRSSDLVSLKACQQSKKLYIRHCHAGLLEVTAPLLENDAIIGYLMIGQIAASSSMKNPVAHLRSYLRQFPEIQEEFDSRELIRKDEKEIAAAVKIMEALLVYAQYNKSIGYRKEEFVRQLNEYISAHLAEPLDAQTIAKAFSMSRSKLYSLCGTYLKMGIGQYIKAMRIEAAKNLLLEGDLSLKEIADQVGLGDYNYFCRSFKKTVGMPAKAFQRRNRGS
ncbi:MAG: PocR ligand-binding domain-containing protein [Bacilli bacterium]|nr:PocR ligand-binding domain-containing protein [Bacilli bacterium]